MNPSVSPFRLFVSYAHSAPEAVAQYATAAQLIREDDDSHRLAEFYRLNAQRAPSAISALAETRIREVEQWYFRRKLRAVAKEIGASDPGEMTQTVGANGVS